MTILNMTNAKLIRHSPDKRNISNHVQQKAADLDETYQWGRRNPKNNYLLLLICRLGIYTYCMTRQLQILSAICH